ncbi:MAG TPA: hypothetical protein VHA33_27960 [Candidatus Angelobacter sp.]|nr:hypothetical protein [Candidatus Angelobacter sp.]
MIKFRYALPLLVLGSSLTMNGWAQQKRSTKRTSAPVVSLQVKREGTLIVAFTNTPDGANLTSGAAGQRGLELGTISYGMNPRTPNVQVRHLRDRFIVVTRFGLSIQDPTLHSSSASVLAALASPDVGHLLWLDGVRLGTVPKIIHSQLRVGPVSSHLLEIEVPTSLTEQNAQLHNAIIFQVIPN